MQTNLLSRKFKKHLNAYWIFISVVTSLSFFISATIISYQENYILPIIMVQCVGLALGTLFAYIHRPKLYHWINMIHKMNPKAEYSLELLLTSRTTGLQYLQKKKMEQLFLELTFPKTPKRIALIISLWICTVPLFLYNVIYNSKRPEFSSEITLCCDYPMADSVQVRLLKKTIFPPSYSRLPIDSSEQQLPLQMSRVAWEFSIKGPLKNVWAETILGDSIPLYRSGTSWKLEKMLQYPFYFTLAWKTTTGKIGYSQGWSQKIRNDMPPIIRTDCEQTYHRMTYHSRKNLKIKIEAEDDFEIDEIMAVATVATGSGEAIQFREKEIQLSRKSHLSKQELTWNITFDSLGMKPGSELYFYILAYDNKYPVRQKSQTSTFFVVLEDTTEIEYSMAGGLGVDILPDYFRSQLQIILDTEKLLANQRKIKKELFNSTSNELGFDQKQLRLRYGQFIGEEEDSGLEIDQEEPITEEVTDTEEEILAEYGHSHDHENEHALEKEDEDEDPLHPYLHTHDDEEVATFLEVSMKAKLKAALSEMWDAELYLRLYQPLKSLPYQRRALELLNEIRNHARIYVLRMGFDPPPMAEIEHRLKKEVENKAILPLQILAPNDTLLTPLKSLLGSEKLFSKSKLEKDQLLLIKKANHYCAMHFLENPQLNPELIQLLNLAEKKESITKEEWIRIVSISSTWLNKKINVGGQDKKSSDTLTTWFLERLTNN